MNTLTQFASSLCRNLAFARLRPTTSVSSFSSCSSSELLACQTEDTPAEGLADIHAFGPGLDRQLGQRHPGRKAGYLRFARIFLMHSLGDPLYSAVVAVQWNSCELSKNPPRCSICLFSRRLVANFPVARDSETVCNLLQKNPPNREGKGIRFDRHRSRRPICSCPFPQGGAEHRATRDRTSIFRGGSAL